MEPRVSNRQTEGKVARTAKNDWLAPPVDVYENNDEILLVTDVPGVENEGLTIELDRGELRFEARRSNGGHTARTYRRVFTVPDGIDANAVKAELSDGVLYVHLPKAADVKPRRIQVTAS